jgi:cytidylate kinase
MKELGASAEEAKQRVVTTESERKAYIRQYFHAEFLDPTYYDLVLNTAYLSLDASLETIQAAWNARKSRSTGS